MMEFLKDLLRFDQIRRHAKRFEQIASFARQQNEAMDAEPNPRSPEGDDWNDLYDRIQPYETD